MPSTHIAMPGQRESSGRAVRGGCAVKWPAVRYARTLVSFAGEFVLIVAGGRAASPRVAFIQGVRNGTTVP
jgi:hypothetical protein